MTGRYQSQIVAIAIAEPSLWCLEIVNFNTFDETYHLPETSNSDTRIRFEIAISWNERDSTFAYPNASTTFNTHTHTHKSARHFCNKPASLGFSFFDLQIKQHNIISPLYWLNRIEGWVGRHCAFRQGTTLNVECQLFTAAVSQQAVSIT